MFRQFAVKAAPCVSRADPAQGPAIPFCLVGGLAQQSPPALGKHAGALHRRRDVAGPSAFPPVAKLAPADGHRIHLTVPLAGAAVPELGVEPFGTAGIDGGEAPRC